jgi:Ca2+-binding EF-hand superfamily protein
MKRVMLFLLLMGAFLAVNTQEPAKSVEKNARAAYKEILKETDKDKDGKLSKKEFYSIWKDQQVAEKNYKAWDTNKDGFITEEEYVKAAVDMGKKK